MVDFYINYYYRLLSFEKPLFYGIEVCVTTVCKTLSLISDIKGNNSSHHTQDGYHYHESKNIKMLARKQGERSTYMLLLEIRINITTIKTYMEVSQKQNIAAIALQGV